MRWGFTGLICFVTALLCNILGSNNKYWATHSLWHVFVMLSALCVIKTLPFKHRHDEFYVGNEALSDELDMKDMSPRTAL